MKNALTIFLISMCSFVYAQEFSFTLFFSDTLGNQDSLIIGYDEAATAGIDDAFGELDIADLAYDSVFDVRSSNEWIRRLSGSDDVLFHTKKQIVNDMYGYALIPIDIKCKYPPITVSWDSTLFEAQRWNGSLITAVPPGGWWDVGAPSDLWMEFLVEQSSVSFSENYILNPNFNTINENYAFISGTDTLSYFWVALGYNGIGVSTKEAGVKEQLKLYPNPVKETLHLAYDIDLLGAAYQLRAGDGQLLLSGQLEAADGKELDVSGLAAGIYFVELNNGKEQGMWKFVKL